MMDNKIADILWSRLDKLEDKIDRLLEFKWQVIGGTILASIVLTTIFQIALVMIDKH